MQKNINQELINDILQNQKNRMKNSPKKYYRPHIFINQLNVTTKAKDEGTEIGLYMTAQIINKNNSEITVKT